MSDSETYDLAIIGRGPRRSTGGDAIGPPALAAASMEQGHRAVCHASGTDPGLAFDLVPIGVYAIPELASVGLTEEQARLPDATGKGFRYLAGRARRTR